MFWKDIFLANGKVSYKDSVVINGIAIGMDSNC